MRKTAIASVLTSGLLVAGCGVKLEDIAAEIAKLVADPTKGCNAIVSVEALVKAFTGYDAGQINVVAFVNSICSQFKTAEQTQTPQLKASKAGCYNVIVVGKPVEVCEKK